MNLSPQQIGLISDEHSQQYREYYSDKTIPKNPSRWQQLIEELGKKHGCESILDYGCGGYPRLKRHVKGFDVRSYDPALPGFDMLPVSADMVVCLDVLEHVEGNCLDAVISHLLTLPKKLLLVNISTQASSKTLPNGMPWHCMVMPKEFWKARFPLAQEIETDQGREEITLLQVFDSE